MCRLEKHIINNKLIIFDVGHNASGIVNNQIIILDLTLRSADDSKNLLLSWAIATGRRGLILIYCPLFTCSIEFASLQAY